MRMRLAAVGVGAVVDVRGPRYPRMGTVEVPIHCRNPRESFHLLCVRCGAGLFYVRQDRARKIYEHHFECRRCGQKHAAWGQWHPGT